MSGAVSLRRWLAVALLVFGCGQALAQIGNPPAARPAPAVTAAASAPRTIESPPPPAAPQAARGRANALGEYGADPAPAEPVPWGLIITTGVLALLALGAGAAALYFILWPQRVEQPAPDSRSPPSRDAVADLRRDLELFKKRIEERVGRLEGDAANVEQRLRDLRLEFEQASPRPMASPSGHGAAVHTHLRTPYPAMSPTRGGSGMLVPNEPWPPLRGPAGYGIGGAESGEIDIEFPVSDPPRTTPGDLFGASAYPAQVRRPKPAPAATPTLPPSPSPITPRQFLAALQQAAAAALADAPCDDPMTFTQAVQMRIPAEIRGHTGVREFRFSGHSASAGLAQTFTWPDFISVQRPKGETWLLPNPSVDFKFDDATIYAGEKGWPHVKQPALCSIDVSGRAVLTQKGLLE